MNDVVPTSPDDEPPNERDSTLKTILAALRWPDAIMGYVLFGAASVATGLRAVPPEIAFGAAVIIYAIFQLFRIAPAAMKYMKEVREIERKYDLEELKVSERRKKRRAKAAAKQKLPRP